MANRPGFAVAMSRTFKLPDETTMDFMRTFKELSQEDRLAYYEILKAGGIDCDPPTSL